MKNSFQKLCSACDVLLKKNSRNLTFNAISSLHVLRGHPEPMIRRNDEGHRPQRAAAHGGV
jgi:hypothetical protein